MKLGQGRLAWRNLLAAGLVLRMVPLLSPGVTTGLVSVAVLVASVGSAVWVLRGGPWSLLIGTYAAASGLSSLLFAFVLPAHLEWALAGLISIPVTLAGWQALRTLGAHMERGGTATVSRPGGPAASRRPTSAASRAASQPGAPNVRRRSQARADRPRGRGSRDHR